MKLAVVTFALLIQAPPVDPPPIEFEPLTHDETIAVVTMIVEHKTTIAAQAAEIERLHRELAMLGRFCVGARQL
jgi:hypothetical protein